MDERIKELPGDDIIEMERCIVAEIPEAATKTIATKKIGQKPSIWMTKEILEAMKQRDKLKITRHNNEEAYKEMVEKVKELINTKKQDIWKKKIIKSQKSKNMWQLMKNLDGGTTKTNKKAIVYNGTTRTADRQKANAFIHYYKNISKCQLNKQEKRIKKKLNQELRKRQPSNEYTKEFNMQELITALHRINGNKAGGPDQVHPRMLHRLGPEALKYILQMFNESWKNMRTPQNWRLADIRPIHKKDKNPEAVSSYRPISLTSVIGKWLERMVTNRLRNQGNQATP